MKNFWRLFIRICFGFFVWIFLIIVAPIRLVYNILLFFISFWKPGAINKLFVSFTFFLYAFIGFAGITSYIRGENKITYVLVNIFTNSTRINYGNGWTKINKFSSKADLFSYINPQKNHTNKLKADIIETEISTTEDK